MELSVTTAEVYLRRAFGLMLEVADRLGEPKVNERPLGRTTNSVAALIVHCCGVSEFWLGHIALGRETTRDRDGEFTASATLAELHQLVAATCEQAVADVGRLDAGEGTDVGGRRALLVHDQSDASVVVHVLEELYQHVGHMELAADALASG